ncbi:MAG: EAL domain-containing protein [Gammaproteobacteria bacterium]
MPDRILDKLRYSSLRTRYAIASVVLAMVLLAVTTLTSFFTTNVREQTAHHILERKEFLQQARYVRSAIWNVEKSLQSFLLDPHIENSVATLRDHIDTSLLATEYLQQKPWLNRLGQHDNLKEFYASLQQLRTALTELVETRLNTNQQYPALAYSRRTMLPLNTRMVTAINLALEELQEADTLDTEVYIKLLTIRHFWTQIISNFRMYLANRLGSFDEQTLPVQQNDIEVTLHAVLQQITGLQQQAETGRLGLQTSVSLEEAQTLVRQWQTHFAEVVNIHATDKWRADADMLRTTINPFFDQLWERLQALDIAIESSSDLDMETLGDANRFQSLLLWGMFASGLLFILVVYFVLDRLLLRPVKEVVMALQAETHGHQEALLPAPKSEETRQLINAFKEMCTQIHSRQKALEHQALHDSLTGLANRHLLFDRLQQAIQLARRVDQPVALYILDLDRFKEINDTLGHQVGDGLLTEVGARLSQTLRDSDTVARLGGDEFAILIENCSEAKAIHIARKILSAFEQTYQVDNLHLYLGVSIGIAFYPEHDYNAQGLIQHADIAMYTAKRNKSGYAIYDAAKDQHSISRLALHSDLREAIEGKDQLQLFYQPKQNLRSDRVKEVESLLRWQHPQHGWIPPSEIIPLAEHTGLIQPLTYWVIEEAIRQHFVWKKASLDIRISVNISAFNLQDKAFLPKVQSLLARHDTRGDFLMFELTESAMMADPAHAIATITEFTRLGIQFSIDDFGTGFSSLSYLKQLPVQELKIDKSFVLNMTTNDNDAVIVRSIIELAHNLSLRVVAEGIEHADALELLRILDCDSGQGFYIKRPAAATDITAWLLDLTHTENRQIHG